MVRRDKNKKTISVVDAFGGIRITVKAPYEVWLQWEQAFMDHLCDHEPFPYELIEDYLSLRTPEDTKKALQEYAEKEPEGFAWDFHNYFIMPAAALNPLIVKKPRRAIHELTALEMIEVRRTARHLYVFLSIWLPQKKNEWPDTLKKYLQNHDVFGTDAKTVTMEIITTHFGLDNKLISYPEMFYKEYIADSEISSLRKVYCQVYHEGRNPLLLDPLRNIFLN